MRMTLFIYRCATLVLLAQVVKIPIQFHAYYHLFILFSKNDPKGKFLGGTF